MLLLNNHGIADAQAGAIADAIVARAYGEGYLMGISANCGSWPVSIVSIPAPRAAALCGAGC
ncbi:hypothetical protein J4732_11665 [Serratia marcescens]|uniref:Uncharacterized protein n=1 Tax=Serratia marcescens TaxID=615 RepID=A0A939NL09_SERMA|nr:hypothetical protein [Serratia marcescens]